MNNKYRPISLVSNVAKIIKKTIKRTQFIWFQKQIEHTGCSTIAELTPTYFIVH